MKDYINYTITDFILDDSYRRWVLKNTTVDGAFWDELLKKYPFLASEAEAARQFILKIHQAQDNISDEEIRKELARLSESRVSEAVFVKPLLNRISIWAKAVAAALVVGIVGLLYVFYQQQKSPVASYEIRKKQLGNQLVEVINNEATVKTIQLPDGSKVQLQSGSRLSYPAEFAAQNREVYLSGEGLFDVIKNPKQPFMVYANEVVTKVLGTSFIVKAFEKADKVEVIVKTGKVSVYSVKESETKTPTSELSGLILTPNQLGVFDRKQEQLEKTLVSVPEPIVGPETENNTTPTNVFDNTPVSQAFESLSRTYGITIVYDKSILKNCEISAEFVSENFYEQLDLICKAIEANYKINDGQIMIESKGCLP